MKTFYLQPQLINSLRGYNKRQLTNDIIAGIIVAIIALPLSIALALASGVEPACGIYTAIAAGFMVSLLGGSTVQIAGPTAAFATIVAGVVATQGMDGLFLATVIAGVLLVLFGGIPATGAIARTSANAKNGGRTPIAGMVHAVVLLLVLLFLMPYAALIPMPTIAAILFMVAYNMSEWKKFVAISKKKQVTDIVVLFVTFAFTVIFDLVVAIAVGIVLTLVFWLVGKFVKKGR